MSPLPVVMNTPVRSIFDANAVSLAVLPFTAVAASISPRAFTDTVVLSVLPLPDVVGSIEKFVPTVAVSTPARELASINGTVGPPKNSLAMAKIVEVRSRVLATVDPLVGPTSPALIEAMAALVRVAVGKLDDIVGTMPGSQTPASRVEPSVEIFHGSIPMWSPSYSVASVQAIVPNSVATSLV